MDIIGIIVVMNSGTIGTIDLEPCRALENQKIPLDIKTTMGIPQNVASPCEI